MPEDRRDVIDLSEMLIGLHRDQSAEVLESPAGPPRRIEGYTMGAPKLTREPPHAGEMHPDGDEILFLVSGRVRVILEDESPPRDVPLGPGDGLVVPRGVWHRIRLLEPSQLIHITPGPGGEHRPL